MGILGGDSSKQQGLQEDLAKAHAVNKKLNQELAHERKRSAALELELGKVRADLTTARLAVAKARKRQKASVARANRFKTQAEQQVAQES